MAAEKYRRIIFGPPGCGKTTRLLALADEALNAGIPPERIGLFSFTRKAVTEAKTRAADKFGLALNRFPFFRTIHSACYAACGMNRGDVMGPLQYADLGDLLGVKFGSARIDETTGLPSVESDGDLHLFLHALARNRCVSLMDQWHDSALPDLDYYALERTVNALEAFKKSRGFYDFTDMPQNAARDAAPLPLDVAFIDEAQDLSTLQWRVLKRLIGNVPRIYIAGDDDQAIYRWSGANVETFLALRGEREILGRSYRCASAIHGIADTIAGRITTRVQKDWRPDKIGGAVQTVHSLESLDFSTLPGSTLVLARNTFLLPRATSELRKRGLPYRTSHGRSSIQKTHVAALLAWERLRKGEEIPGRGVLSLYEAIQPARGLARGAKVRAKDQIVTENKYTFDQLRNDFGLEADPARPWFEALTAMPETDVDYYRAVLRSGESLTKEPRFHVNTIHGVKGGEADNVLILPDMAKKSFEEYQKRPDDEHRLAYVAVSRARYNLFLVDPDSRMFYSYPA